MSIPIRWAAGMLPGPSAAIRTFDGPFCFAKMAGCPTNPRVAAGMNRSAERA